MKFGLGKLIIGGGEYLPAADAASRKRLRSEASAGFAKLLRGAGEGAQLVMDWTDRELIIGLELADGRLLTLSRCALEPVEDEAEKEALYENGYETFLTEAEAIESAENGAFRAFLERDAELKTQLDACFPDGITAFPVARGSLSGPLSAEVWWTYDEETRTLRVTGRGDADAFLVSVPGYQKPPAPFSLFISAGDIRAFEIGSGVGLIRGGLFEGQKGAIERFSLPAGTRTLPDIRCAVSELNVPDDGCVWGEPEEAVPSGTYRVVLLKDRAFLCDESRASWFLGEYAEIIYESLLQIGITPDLFGFYKNVRPHIAAFTHDCWDKLDRLLREPGVSVAEVLAQMIPDLRDAYNEYLQKYLRDRDYGSGFDFWKYIDSFLKDELSVTDDPEIWINTPVRLNLGLNVDSFSDYVLNVTYPAYGWREYDSYWRGFFHKSSVMWLTRRQGYTQRQLRDALRKVIQAAELDDPLKMIPSKYLYSAAMEIWSELSDHNQLGFFVLVPLKEALLAFSMKIFGERLDKWQGCLLLDPSVSCGFFTTWVGSCSLIGIRLERAVRVPLSDLDVFPDGAKGYSMIGVHEDAEVWQPDKILRWNFTRAFVQRVKREDPVLYRCILDLRAKDAAVGGKTESD